MGTSACKESVVLPDGHPTTIPQRRGSSARHGLRQALPVLCARAQQGQLELEVGEEVVTILLVEIEPIEVIHALHPFETADKQALTVLCGESAYEADEGRVATGESHRTQEAGKASLAMRHRKELTAGPQYAGDLGDDAHEEVEAVRGQDQVEAGIFEGQVGVEFRPDEAGLAARGLHASEIAVLVPVAGVDACEASRARHSAGDLFGPETKTTAQVENLLGKSEIDGTQHRTSNVLAIRGVTPDQRGDSGVSRRILVGREVGAGHAANLDPQDLPSQGNILSPCCLSHLGSEPTVRGQSVEVGGSPILLPPRVLEVVMMGGASMSSSYRWFAMVGGGLVVLFAGAWFLRPRSDGLDREAIVQDVLSEASTARVRATCSSCHVFPTPDILPRDYWLVAIPGMYQIAEERGVSMAVSQDRSIAWYGFQAPEQLPPAAGRSDAGPGPVAWEVEGWRPSGEGLEPEQRPAVTHLQMASLFDGDGLDVIVSDVSTNRVYALRPYAPELKELTLGTVPNPGRVAVTDLDQDGARDVVVAALGQLAPTNDPVGSVVWLRRSGLEDFQEEVLVDGLGRVADLRAVDLQGNERIDLVVAVFGWMENGSLLWLENTGDDAGSLSFVQHVLDPRPGFTDVRVEDLDQDGRLDVVALIAQEFQQVMVYWREEDGFRSEMLYQAPNPDWGFTGLEVVDFSGNGFPDLIVTNGDNLDLTVAKPYHGVAMLENLGEGAFEYRHLTSMYGAHRAAPVDLTGDGRLGLVVSAYLPPSVSSRAPAPAEALLWLERVGPTQLVRRVLESEGVHHMAMAVGEATGDGRSDLAVGFMDLGVVDPRQAHRGEPLSSFVTLWRNLGMRGPATRTEDVEVIDWRQDADSGNR